jgi:signal transduction histidine kinase
MISHSGRRFKFPEWSRVLAGLPDQSGTPPVRLLIVDDVADNRTILSRRFQRQGFECAEAASGQDALGAIERESFDVVLLDVNMPDLNGMEVLGRIREKYSQEMLAVIMVTGNTRSEDIVEALNRGANDYITKPVDFAVALARVTVQAGRKRAEERVREANLALTRANDDLERRIAERTAELVRTNAQLVEAVAEAQAAGRAKDEFLSALSHELRTPLNGMLAMSALLAQTNLDVHQAKMAGVIQSSAEAMTAMVTDLLDALDLTTNALRLHVERVKLGDVIRQVSAAAEARATAKGLNYRLDLAPEAEGVVHVDGRRLSQILSKLLNNAVKFADAGEVRLTVSRAPAEPERVIVEVRDTGIGFEPGAAERLFSAFQQADGSLARRFGGLGLGLAICRGLVERMGGAISAQGETGRGAVFRVELPLPAQASDLAA